MNRGIQVGTILLTILLSACATSNSARAPDVDLSRLKSFYVTRLPSDERGIEKLIASRLTTMGYESSFGDAPAPPSPVDAIVTYQDRWVWDLTMYMTRLNIQIRDGTTSAVVANGEVMRPSLQRKSPKGMVEETLEVIFK